MKDKKDKVCEKEDSVFKVLAKKPTAEYVSKRKVGNTELSYISWADAWTALMTVYPDATYEVIKDVDTNLPYFGSDIGFMVETKITVNSISRNMMLPVLDNKNKAMKKQAYTYTTNYGEKTVDSATMFDINTAIMRCLVKNIAIFGFGINVYKGEDLPLNDNDFMSKSELVTKNRIDTAIKVVRAAFENPGDKELQIRLVKARKWAIDNEIVQVLDEIIKQEEAVEKEELEGHKAPVSEIEVKETTVESNKQGE